MIYIISSTPFPNGWASTNRIKCYAKALTQERIATTMIIYRPTETRGIERGNRQQGTDDGIPYIHIGPLYIHNNKRINKLLDIWSLVVLYLFLRKNVNAGDTVYFYHDPFIFIKLFVRLVHKKGAKYMVELCEYPNCALNVETPRTIAKSKRILNEYFPLYDGVIAISHDLECLARQYVNNYCKIIRIPILVDLEHKKINDFSDCSEIPYIFHSGSLTEKKDGFLGMLKAFGRAHDKLNGELHFISTGDPQKSPISKEIADIIKLHNLADCVHFLGYLSDSEVLLYLQKASLVIINKYRTKQNQYCFSTKLAEYMAASKPIIITNYGESVYWLKDKVNAYIVEPGDDDDLANAILTAMNNKEERLSIGRNGFELCRNCFDYRSYQKEIKLFFC